MASLQMPDHIYNWIRHKDFFDGHTSSHCTKYAGCASDQTNLHASVIQRSVIGPASYGPASAAGLQVLYKGTVL